MWLQSRAKKRLHTDKPSSARHHHPDLPLEFPPRRRNSPDRSSASAAGDRRSIAVETPYPSAPDVPDVPPQATPQSADALSRSPTVLRQGSASSPTRRPNSSYLINDDPSNNPSEPTLDLLLSRSERAEAARGADTDSHHGGTPVAPYHSNIRKSSSDSGQSGTLDRWSQRRLQRLNTEQGFREQRQGGPGVLSPPLSQDSSYSNASGAQYAQHTQHPQPSQPHPPAYQTRSSGPTDQPNAGLSVQTQSVSTSSLRGNNYAQHDTQLPQASYSPPESASQYQPPDASRPPLTQSRSFNNAQQEDSMSSNNGGQPPAKTSRSGMNNRQSVHNGLSSREGSGLGGQSGNHAGVPAYNTNVVPSADQGYGNTTQQQVKSGGDGGRGTPQPNKPMTKEDIEQLVQDHAQLREKYTKVKKYYFEKEDQVKTLQNSLAHQRLSSSRTSLDDSEYTTRFTRLDGLVAQLAFSIRKSWRSIPTWLVSSVNKDAVVTGKQEMTAAGRAFISCWLVEEVFDKYFHPDLEPTLSAQLKSIQNNIRRFAPVAQTAEEQEYLTSKVVNWRLATLEGLQEALRSPQCATNRAQLTDMLKEQLVAALSVHLQEPPPSDLEGGVHMIVELVVSIAIHLPLESRDVSIEYFMPGYSILPEQMKMETGIPPLTMSIAEDAAERASGKTDVSDITDNTDANTLGGESTKKRSMLSALTGSSKKESAQRKHAGAGGSSSSLNRPESSQGPKQDAPPRVRMSAGIGVQIRGRSVLVKAPVFATTT